MKLDRLKFAKLVAHCVSNGMSAGEWEVEKLDVSLHNAVKEFINRLDNY